MGTSGKHDKQEDASVDANRACNKSTKTRYLKVGTTIDALSLELPVVTEAVGPRPDLYNHVRHLGISGFQSLHDGGWSHIHRMILDPR
jgi:hypothetical protein